MALLRELGVDYVLSGETMDETIKTTGCQMGFELDNLSERLFVYGHDGQRLDETLQNAIPYILQIKLMETAKVVLPVGTPHVLVELAKNNSKEAYESRSARYDAIRLSIALNDCTVPDAEFMHGFGSNAFFVMAALLHFLSVEGITFGEFVESIPEFHTATRNIDCRYRDIGKVIRNMHEEGAIRAEGVRVEREGGWAVILPDSGRPAIKVISHGMSENMPRNWQIFI